MSIIELTPLNEFQRALHRWWLIVILTVAGGMVGWIYHLIEPPLYDARAVVVADIDFAQTGKLDEIEQDQLVGAAFSLLGSTQVLQETLDDIRTQGIPFPDFVYGKNTFMERRQSQLILLVRDKDPRLAAQVVNLWLENAYRTLTEAHDHALRAQVLRNYLSAMQDCPSPPPAEPDLPNLCGAATVKETQKAILSVEADLEKEILLSQGIIPALTIDESLKARIPQEPISQGGGLLLLGGALSGFILGVIAASVRFQRVK